MAETFDFSVCENQSRNVYNGRHGAIMFWKLSIILLSIDSKITYYAFKKMPIIPKIMPSILANNVILAY